MKAAILYNKFFDHDGEYQMIGGVETYILNLARVCRELNFETIIYQFSNRPFEECGRNKGQGGACLPPAVQEKESGSLPGSGKGSGWRQGYSYLWRRSCECADNESPSHLHSAWNKLGSACSIHNGSENRQI